MCMWPPLAVVPDEAWTCDDCKCKPPPLRPVPVPGDELEVEVEEPPEKGGAVLWKRAVVLKAVPPQRAVLMINPDEEDGAPLTTPMNAATAARACTARGGAPHTHQPAIHTRTHLPFTHAPTCHSRARSVVAYSRGRPNDRLHRGVRDGG